MRRLATGLLVALFGCADAGPTASAPPQLRTVVEGTYGDADGPGALSGVFDVAVAPVTGRVFASEPAFGRVVAFAQDGGFAGVMGRRGSGPGEFQSPARLGWVGDTLSVLDFRRGITLLGTDGRYLGRVSFERAFRANAFPLHPFVLLPDGAVAAMAPVPDGMAAEGAVTTETWLRTARDGETLDTLLVRDLRGRAFILELGGRRGSAGHPLAFDPLLAAAPDGSVFVLVERVPPVGGAPARFRVVRIGPGGDTLAAVSLPYRPVAVDGAARDSIAGVVARARSGGTGLTEERLRDLVLEQLPWPPSRPPVTAAVAGLDGTVWLRREAPASDSVRWDVLDASLRPVGFAVLPEELEVKVVTAREVYGVRTDSLDVPSIVRYGVEAPDGTEPSDPGDP